ncbi:MAG TPA: HlyD family efflux transporter periplasmic adaptor subunit [Thermoanaerobaculia bacterium]|nr:HlyD family efflux transporter periplasmic adaptor subunit [Thermoanaerobaculia bacterium]
MIPRLAATAAFAAFLLLPGCNRPKEDSADAPAAHVRVPVSVRPLVRGSIEAAVTAAGSTEALRREKVLSPVAGRVVSLAVLEGSFVHAGEVMLVLRTREAQATLEGADALLRSATTELQRAEAERAHALADSVQGRIVIRASFDGVVASRNVTEGELVAEQTELLTLIDPATIIFVAEIPAANIGRVRAGLAARVHLTQSAAGELEASVDAVSPEADAQSQSVKARLRFRGLSGDAQRSMKSNLAGTARIITEMRRDVLLVGRSALLHDDESDTYSIVLMTPDSLARIVPVAIGAQADSVVEIRGRSLREGQEVIVKGQYALADSTRVTVEPE